MPEVRTLHSDNARPGGDNARPGGASALEHRRRRLARGRQAGLTLAEVLAGIVVLGATYFTLAQLQIDNARDVRIQAAAQQMRMVREAARSFVRDNLQDVRDGLGDDPIEGTDNDGITTIPPNLLTAGNYLPESMEEGAGLVNNPFGQTYSILVRTPSPTNPDALEVLVVTEPLDAGAEDFDSVTQGRLASLLGSQGAALCESSDDPAAPCNTGGAVSDGNTAALGAFNSYVIDMDSAYGGVAPQTGGVAMSVFLGPNDIIADYLHRFEIPGVPEANTMFTDLHMRGNRLEFSGEAGASPPDDDFGIYEDELTGNANICGNNAGCLVFEGIDNGGASGSSFLFGARTGGGTLDAIMEIESSGRVGINTTNPAQQLHVVGNAAISNRLGVGTTGPNERLHVRNGDALFDNGNATIRRRDNQQTLLTLDADDAGGSEAEDAELRFQRDGDNQWRLVSQQSGVDSLSFISGNLGEDVVLSLTPGGNVIVHEGEAADPAALQATVGADIDARTQGDLYLNRLDTLVGDQLPEYSMREAYVHTNGPGGNGAVVPYPEQCNNFDGDIPDTPGANPKIFVSPRVVPYAADHETTGGVGRCPGPSTIPWDSFSFIDASNNDQNGDGQTDSWRVRWRIFAFRSTTPFGTTGVGCALREITPPSGEAVQLVSQTYCQQRFDN